MKSKIVLLLSVSILLSACSDRFSLMKRRYSKGYYFSSSSNRSQQATPVAETLPSKPIKADEVATVVVPPSATAAEPAGTALRHFAKSETASPSKKEQRRTLATRDNSPDGAAVNFGTRLQKLRAVTLAPETLRTGATDSDTMLIILVILAIFIPPLAVYLKDKAVSTWFWVTLILCVLSLGVFFFRLGGLLWLAAAVIALLYVLDMI
jgi:uncharacterized membrane protein YqaE (UPF0057 family)